MLPSRLLAMPLISVLMPTCDRSALLYRAVASVLAQTESSFELVLIDNNRREPPVTEQFANAPWLADQRVRVIRPAHVHNAAAARNAGLAVAAGEWLTYLDDDDAYRPSKLARQLERAISSGAPLILCGAEFHLGRRRRIVQCEQSSWAGDELILQARWNTPLLFHRRRDDVRFDESLSPGEDAEFAHRVLSRAGASIVPNVPEPLVDIYPQEGPRVNTNPAPLRPAAARILALRRGYYSRVARRRFVLKTMLGVAKLTQRPAACFALSGRLLRESRGADWRSCANAMLVSLGIFRNRWVS